MFKMPTLPYGLDGLEPYISEKTLSYHYGKHHKAYVDNLNKFVEASASVSYKGMSVEQIVAGSEGGLFNNAAQAYNHTFYWHCMRPNSTGGDNLPSDELTKILIDSFGSVDQFKEEFTEMAKKHFGSGWAWLLRKKDGSIEIAGMHDADTPLMNGDKPLLALDVWEHAYYLDYQNGRPDYIQAFWKVVNWDFVLEKLKEDSAESLMSSE